MLADRQLKNINVSETVNAVGRHRLTKNDVHMIQVLLFYIHLTLGAAMVTEYGR